SCARRATQRARRRAAVGCGHTTRRLDWFGRLPPWHFPCRCTRSITAPRPSVIKCKWRVPSRSLDDNPTARNGGCNGRECPFRSVGSTRVRDVCPCMSLQPAGGGYRTRSSTGRSFIPGRYDQQPESMAAVIRLVDVVPECVVGLLLHHRRILERRA